MSIDQRLPGAGAERKAGPLVASQVRALFHVLRPGRFRLRWRMLVHGVWVSGAVAVLLTAAGCSESGPARTYRVEGPSMEPALREGDLISVEPIPPGGPARGDLLIFPSPGDPSGERLLIARAVGLPGETLAISGGVVSIDGQPLEEPYVVSPGAGNLAETRLPPDKFFVMGDNRPVSVDSRLFGPIDRSALLGRVVPEEPQE